MSKLKPGLNARITRITVRTRIKICGLRDVPTALEAAQSGADAIGLVFYSASSRAIAPDAARQIVAELPAFVASVALFLDADASDVRHVIHQVSPNLLQFHGSESPEFCRSFDMPYMRAVPMAGETKLTDWFSQYADARALLLDGHAPGEAGGSGQSFDWNQSLPGDGPPIILAGGLQPDNVAQAIRTARPYGVDVSSGVESARGVKDKNKIQAFIDAVHRVDCE